MIKMPFLLIDNAPGLARCTLVSANEAIEIRDQAKRSGQSVSFMCPICKQRAKPHGGNVPVHGEHFRDALKCEENNTICKES